MTEVVGAAKNNHHISIGDHVTDPGRKILIINVCINGRHMLLSDPGAADAVAVDLGSGKLADLLPINVFRIGNPAALGDAVT